MNAVRRRTAIFAAIAIAAIGWSCRPASDAIGVKAPVGAAGPKSDLLGYHLLACSPLTADSVTVPIGPDGGTISVGPHQLVIPAGALDSTIDITAIVPHENVNRVTFYPEGLTFNTPASLTMSYANCGVVTGLLPKYVVYVNGTTIADILPSLDSFLTRTVTGSIGHFSDYVVAW